MISDLNELRDKVVEWATQKGILSSTTSDKQALKMFEEAGEIAAALCRNDRTKLIDSIGDTLVCLICLSEVCDLSLEGCLEVAYSEISGRKGEMRGGVFVKTEDLDDLIGEPLDEDKKRSCMNCQVHDSGECMDVLSKGSCYKHKFGVNYDTA